MKLSVVLLIIALLIPVSLERAFAASKAKEFVIAEWDKGGIHFSIPQAAIGEFLTLPQSSRLETVFAVTLEFRNGTSERKIDLAKGFSFAMQDEFLNSYRQIDSSSLFLPNGFSANLSPISVYPEGIYRRTIYFESPVAKSENLILKINAQNIGIADPIALNIARKMVRNLVPPLEPRTPKDDDFSVIAPAAGTPVRPGTVVHVGIKFPQDIRRPNAIFIVAPDFTFEDPGTSCQYDVRIPKNQPQGPYVVVVMARWGTKAEIVLSKSIMLEVVGQASDVAQTKRAKYLD